MELFCSIVTAAVITSLIHLTGLILLHHIVNLTPYCGPVALPIGCIAIAVIYLCVLYGQQREFSLLFSDSVSEYRQQSQRLSVQCSEDDKVLCRVSVSRAGRVDRYFMTLSHTFVVRVVAQFMVWRLDMALESFGLQRVVWLTCGIGVANVYDSDLVYSVPNYGEKKKLMNRHHLRDNIALVDRGEVTLLEKVKNIQKVPFFATIFTVMMSQFFTQSGALAVIIVDDGQCDEHFQHCGHRIGSPVEGGFGAYDAAVLWRDVTVPVLLVTLPTGEKIRAMMDNERLEIPLLGWQNVTKYRHADDDGEL